MKVLTALALAAAFTFSSAAFADAGLVKKYGCFACHDASAKKMGPSWKDVAAKHKGEADAEQKLVHSITKGSKGVYGKMPMSPQARAAADAPALAKFILSH